MSKNLVELTDYVSAENIHNKLDEDIPVYSVTHENGFCINYFSKDVAGTDRTTYKIVPRGYFAYNPLRVNVGSIDWQNVQDRVLVSSRYVVFKLISDKIDPQYLVRLLKSGPYLRIIKEKCRGTVRPELTIHLLKKIRIDLKPLQEQREIVKKLDSISCEITKVRHLIDKHDEVVKSRFIELFSNYEKSYNFTDVITDNTRYGYKFDSSFYQKIGEIAIVDQGQDLICGYLDEQEGCEPWVEPSIIFGDHTELFKYVDFPFYLGADGTKLLSASKDWNPIFIYHHLKNNYHPVGGYRRHFVFVKEQKFSKPPMELQLRFAEFVKQVDKSKFKLQMQLNYLNELYKSLEQDVFNVFE